MTWLLDLFVWAYLCLRDRWRRRGPVELLERAMGSPRRLRSWRWPGVRRAHLASEPKCQWCQAARKLEVHHIKPFHMHPELELEPTNLITLCETRTRCHLEHGHLGSWRFVNPSIRSQCAEHAEGKV